jgi:hypothetical protein
MFGQCICSAAFGVAHNWRLSMTKPTTLTTKDRQAAALRNIDSALAKAAAFISAYSQDEASKINLARRDVGFIRRALKVKL